MTLRLATALALSLLLPEAAQAELFKATRVEAE